MRILHRAEDVLHEEDLLSFFLGHVHILLNVRELLLNSTKLGLDCAKGHSLLDNLVRYLRQNACLVRLGRCTSTSLLNWIRTTTSF